MILCVAIDDNKGMMFNRRRQSQDKRLRAYLLEMLHGRTLYMNTYSAAQFEKPLADSVVADDAFLEKAGDKDVCFVEDQSLENFDREVSSVILFHWNRVYPADLYFAFPMPEHAWHVESVAEFEGNSHEKITVEVWKHETA